ncbi:glycerate kinase [Clostridioides difficile]|nr:glycerate kinase family protein [Clostridioides difficile CD165]VFC11651.1 glycerate kinase [Clostridioides difficile]VFC11658.1 glycerate kinase [Clostridioides difficile]VHR79084.1 glycerate kinase [Clostridioides difficile]
MDNQTAMGKAPIGVAKLAKKYGVKVIGLAGATTEDAVKCNEEGIDAYFSIVNRAMTIEEAMDKATASENMTATTTQIFNLITSIQQSKNM